MQINTRQYSWTLVCSGVVLAFAALSTSIDARLSLVVLLGILGLSVILARPFVGLMLFTFLTQLGGLVEALAGNGGQYVLEGLVAATLIGVVVQGPARPRDERWGNNPLALRLAILFLLSGIVSAQFAQYPGEAFEALVAHTSLVVVFFLIVVLGTTRERIIALLLAIFAATIISGSLAALEYAGLADFLGSSDPGSRSNGAASMSNTTAGNMFLIGTFAAGLLAWRMPQWRKLNLATFFIGAGGVVFTMARSAIMLLVLGLSWLGFKVRRARRFPAIALLAAIGIVASLPAVPDKVWERFSDLGNPSADWTLGRRFGYHVVGFQLLAEQPLVGIGPGNFGEHYAGFDFRWVEGRRIATRGLHNTYLSVAVEYGLLGFALFAAMILVVLSGLQRTRRRARDPTLSHLAEAVQFGFVLFLIAMASIPAISNKMLWIVLGIATAIASLEERDFLTRRKSAAIEATGPSDT